MGYGFEFINIKFIVGTYVVIPVTLMVIWSCFWNSYN